MENRDCPAYPLFDDRISTYDQEIFYGLSKREYFASLAMQGYISGVAGWTDGLEGGAARLTHKEAAEEAVGYADALIEALEE